MAGRIEVTEELKRAFAAWSQWSFGDCRHSDEIIEILEADDPIAVVESDYLDGETVDGLLDRS